jgi:2-iminobutanoate/2-iminopropanoate deaminase
MILPFIAPDAAPAIGPYSHGVIASGTFVFLSGQIALHADGTMVDDDITKQTAQVMSNIKTLLASQGLTFNNVVKSTVFLRTMDDFAAMNAVYAEAFGDHRPARSAFAVAGLPKNARVEIEIIACTDDK